MFSVVLDTCILIDFFLIYLKEEGGKKITNSRLKSAQKLLRKFESAEFFNTMCFWGKWELREVIKKIKLEQKYILEGFSTREFGDAKREIELSDSELKLINSLATNTWFRSTRNPLEVNYDDQKKIERFSKKGFGFMDCVLISQAVKSGCEYFITSDRELKKKELLSKEFKIKIIGVKDFLKKLRI